MCIERRFVPLGNTFLSDQQEQALIAAFAANQNASKQKSPVQSQQASPRSTAASTTSEPDDLPRITVGSARRRSQSAPCNTSKVDDYEEVYVESRTLSMPILNGGFSSEPDSPVASEPESPVSHPFGQAKTLPALSPLGAASAILSTSPLPPVPSWPASAPREQTSSFICEHSPLHQQESSQVMNLSTGVCANVGEWGGWAAPMESPMSRFMPVTPMLAPQAAPVMTPPPVHQSAHSPLHAPVAPPAHIPCLPAHQMQSPTTPSAGSRNRRRGSNKQIGVKSHQNSTLILSEMLQDPISRDAPSQSKAEVNSNEDESIITPTIIERLAAGKTAASVLPCKAGEPWLGSAPGTPCKFEPKPSTAREMLRQRGQSFLMQCNRVTDPKCINRYGQLP